jgi:hypothetical protein
MVKALEDIIAKSSSIVFFGGAGVSTESGIPDFRSVDGLYHQKYDYPPETILSHTFWEENPEEFYRFYRDKLIVKGAKPNAAHLRLAKLEQQGKLRAVVTQNIDGLHQAAGSKTVYELHGSTLRNYCTRCGKFYDVDFIANSTGVPRCTECGGIVKPDVTKRAWTRRCCPARWMPSVMPIPSSSAAPVWWCTPPPGSSGISGAIIWWSSTCSPPERMLLPTCASQSPSGRC